MEWNGMEWNGMEWNGIKSPMMLLTLTNRLQLLANILMKTLSNKTDFKNCQYLDGEKINSLYQMCIQANMACRNRVE